MPRKRPQVLGVDLNRSESYRPPKSLRNLPLSDPIGFCGVTFAFDSRSYSAWIMLVIFAFGSAILFYKFEDQNLP